MARAGGGRPCRAARLCGILGGGGYDAGGWKGGWAMSGQRHHEKANGGQGTKQAGGRLALLDAHSLIHRAFYALPALTTSRGEPTGAVFGFARMLLRLLREEEPSHVAVAFDRAGPTFRHADFADYKAHRPEAPAALVPQFALVRELVEAYGLPIYDAEGFEADDVIGTLARQGEAAGCQVLIVTGDRDALQLVGPKVTVLLTRRGIQEMDRFDEERVREELGLTPAQVVDWKGLAGDASDNIPGVPGIGPKTAQKLLARYGTLDAILAHVDEIGGKTGQALREHAETARLSRTLATIRTDVPVQLSLEATRRRKPDVGRLARLFSRLEFRSLLDELLREYPEAASALAGAAAGRPPDAREPALDATQKEPKVQQGDLFAGPEPPAPAEGQAVTAVVDGASGPQAEGGGGGRPPRVAQVGPPPIAARVLGDAGEVVDWVRQVRQRRVGERVALLAVAEGDEAMRASLLGLGLAAYPAAGQSADEGAQAVPSSVVYVPARWLAEAQVRESLAALLGDPALPKVCHDAKRHYVLLHRAGLILAGVHDDLMLAAYLLRPGQGGTGLPDVALQVLGWHLPMPGPGPEKDVAQQVGPALAALVAASPPLRHRLERDGLTWLYERLELPLSRVLADMEICGVAIDARRLAEMGREMEAEAEALTQAIHRLAGEPFNINSPKQLGRILFEKLGLPVLARTKTGPSTSADVLEALADEHEIVAKILEYRQVVKLKSTYVDALPGLVHPETGRLHTTFHQAVTATGRLSSANPNLQNIPVRTEAGRKIRAAFVAGRPGWVLLAADYSQIELRILAHISGDENLVEAFRTGVDIHTKTAAEIFGVPPHEVTPAMRNGAKAVNFGIVYGISSFGLARGTGLSRAEAERYIQGYFQRYPGVKRYMEEIVRLGREQGFVTTLFNRRRYLPELHSRKWAERSFAERAAMNTPIQGSAADIMKAAMVNLHAALRQAGLQAQVVLQVHDELVLELPQEELPQVARLVREHMEGVVKLAVPLEVEVRWGPNWLETQPFPADEAASPAALSGEAGGAGTDA